MKLSVKIVPGAARSEIAGWLGEDLKIRIQAPAVDGKANEGLCEFLAGKLGLPRRFISIASGASARRKILEIEGLTPEKLAAAMPRP